MLSSPYVHLRDVEGSRDKTWGAGGGGVCLTYSFAAFHQKLQEIENILVRGGWLPPLHPGGLVNPSMENPRSAPSAHK